MKEEQKDNNDFFQCKMYITNIETSQKSKEIGIEDLVFDDYIEFEFGNYEDKDYGTLPYKDFKFSINDYDVTFYSPQYANLKKKYQQLETKWKELKEWLENNWKESQDIWFVKIINKMQELEKQNENNK